MCFVIPRNRAKLKSMKVRKDEFDAILKKLLNTPPKPRKEIKTAGKHGSKSPILQKP